jgi:5-methylcytosine-specific restriction endonuclease McrA
MCYCNRNMTDGEVYEHVVKTWTHIDRKPLDVAFVMAEAGLLDRLPHGWRFHDYEQYQPLSAEIKAKRDWDSRRKQLYSIPGLVEAIRARDRDCCRYCRVRVNWKDRRSKHGGSYDHVVPRGENSPENVVVCCLGCNNKKGGRTPEQAGMPLLPPPDPGRDPHEKRTSSDQVGIGTEISADPTRPDPDPIQEHQEHRGSRGALRAVDDENPKVLVKLGHVVLDEDPGRTFTPYELSDELKFRAARARVAYDSASVYSAAEQVLNQRRKRTSAA